MKKIFFLLLVIISYSLNAQLTFIGNDEIQRNYDGYTSGKQTQGLVKLEDKFYYITPNGNFYQTDRTEGGTKIVKQFSPQNIAYLKATNKYVYFGYGSGSGYMQDLARYSPNSGLNIVINPTNNNAMLDLNSQVVPGQNFLVDEVFTNYDKESFLIRKFTKDNFYIYVINDKNDNAKVDLVYTKKLNNNYITTPISVNTELETFKTEVYCNGREKPTGVYETTITINKRTENDDTKYEFKTNFSLLKKGKFPFERFLRTKDKIYTLFKLVDSATSKKSYRLYHYENKSIFGTKYELALPNDDVDTQVLDGEIYISCKGYLAKYNESREAYELIISDKNATKEWQNIAKNTRFLKVGNNYMYRRDYELFIYNSATKRTTNLPNTVNIPIPKNIFGQHSTLAYAGKNSFYFSQVVDNKYIFTRYNTITNTISKIEFPEFKKEKFVEIKAILHLENKFVFLTSYVGKKDKPVYKMFMYNEDGEEPTITVPSFANVDTKIEPTPAVKTEYKTIDIKTFNKQLFLEQLVKILNDQSNQFKDIIGEKLPDGTGYEYKSFVTLEGFGKEKIMDFKRTSQLFRFEAETNSIKGKDKALEFFNMFDILVQKLVAGNTIKREVDIDVKTRKIINFLNTDTNKLLQLDMYSNDFTNPEDAIFTITLRADKVAK